MAVKRRDPFPAFCFKVQLEGVAGFDVTDAVYFKSVTGLRSETEVIPVRAGGVNDRTINLVGGNKWSPLVLKQGFSHSTALMKWREAWVRGPFGDEKPARVSGTIIQLDTELADGAIWNFENAWPSKWELGEYDASKNELQIETLELVHDGLVFNEKATNYKLS